MPEPHRISRWECWCGAALGWCFHHPWEQRALTGAPKAEAAPGKALEREELLLRLLQLLAHLALGSPEEFAGRMQCWVPRSEQEHSKGVFLCSQPSALCWGCFIGACPSYSCFPPFPHAQPAIPWGKNLPCMSCLCLIITQHLID